ncbi:MAG TPA: hypothetical protein VJ044_02495 [Candidatus Hodarchaeales archaeon]|nr:hypothetical protein [Candidatus Hodarchaeales archaeon]
MDQHRRKGQEQCLKKIVNLKRERNRPNPDISLSDFSKQLLTFVSQGYSAGTADIYGKTLRAFQRHVGDHITTDGREALKQAGLLGENESAHPIKHHGFVARLARTGQLERP